MKEEKIIQDKVKDYLIKAKTFFTQFQEVFAKSDKKTFKDNLAPFFGSSDQCSELVAEPYPKYEERAPDKWNDLFKAVYQDGKAILQLCSGWDKNGVAAGF